MQSIQQSKIENMAARIHETGHTYQPGDDVEWMMPGAYNSTDTVQKRESATSQECAEAERLSAEWSARRSA